MQQMPLKLNQIKRLAGKLAISDEIFDRKTIQKTKQGRKTLQGRRRSGVEKINEFSTLPGY